MQAPAKSKKGNKSGGVWPEGGDVERRGAGRPPLEGN